VLTARNDIEQTTNRILETVTPTKEELKKARIEVKKEQDGRITPRGGVSLEMRQVMDHQDDAIGQGFQEPSKSLDALEEEGGDVVVELEVVCSISCGYLEKVSNKGRPPKKIKCSDCGIDYHVNCMIVEDVVGQEWRGAEELQSFKCGECNGNSVYNVFVEPLKDPIVRGRKQKK
jgi:hypothetical protein